MPSAKASVANDVRKATLTESVSSPMKELGLCITCRHQNRCLFVKAARQPIWYCDEFDSGNEGEGDAPRAVPPKPAANLGEGQPEGLCADCAERSDCTQRQPGVAVSECADYR